jgi:hypothetical protein
MAYTHVNSRGVTYYLNAKLATLKGGTQNTIYFFSKDKRSTATDLPDGYSVVENPVNGFLALKKKK